MIYSFFKISQKNNYVSNVLHLQGYFKGLGEGRRLRGLESLRCVLVPDLIGSGVVRAKSSVVRRFRSNSRLVTLITLFLKSSSSLYTSSRIDSLISRNYLSGNLGLKSFKIVLIFTNSPENFFHAELYASHLFSSF